MANNELLDEVMTFIKDNPSKHDQSQWIIGGLLSGLPPQDPECGTAACFAGWTALLSGIDPLQAYSMSQDDAQTIEDFRRNGQWNTPLVRKTAELLGISFDDAHILYSGKNTLEKIELMVKDLQNGEPLDSHWHPVTVADGCILYERNES